DRNLFVSNEIRKNNVKVERVNTQIPGEYVIQYSARDSAGNFATLEIKATVKDRIILPVEDKTPPVITGLNTNPIEIAYGTVYTIPVATAIDNVDGATAVTYEIKFGGVKVEAVDGTKPGEYTILYSATDRAGNKATVEAKVRVKEQTLKRDVNAEWRTLDAQEVRKFYKINSYNDTPDLLRRSFPLYHVINEYKVSNLQSVHGVQSYSIHFKSRSNRDYTLEELKKLSEIKHISKDITQITLEDDCLYRNTAQNAVIVLYNADQEIIGYDIYEGERLDAKVAEYNTLYGAVLAFTDFAKGTINQNILEPKRVSELRELERKVLNKDYATIAEFHNGCVELTKYYENTANIDYPFFENKITIDEQPFETLRKTMEADFVAFSRRKENYAFTRLFKVVSFDKFPPNTAYVKLLSMENGKVADRKDFNPEDMEYFNIERSEQNFLTKLNLDKEHSTLVAVYCAENGKVVGFSKFENMKNVEFSVRQLKELELGIIKNYILENKLYLPELYMYYMKEIINKYVASYNEIVANSSMTTEEFAAAVDKLRFNLSSVVEIKRDIDNNTLSGTGKLVFFKNMPLDYFKKINLEPAETGLDVPFNFSELNETALQSLYVEFQSHTFSDNYKEINSFVSKTAQKAYETVLIKKLKREFVGSSIIDVFKDNKKFLQLDFEGYLELSPQKQRIMEISMYGKKDEYTSYGAIKAVWASTLNDVKKLP
ncbi:MAG: immunoglobulin-like domain-containing protein, partial [Bacilli bacterium]